MLHYGITVLLLAAVSCPAGPVESEITREEAIVIARREASFEPDSVEAVMATSEGRAVWRVTFRGRLPGQPPGLLETVIVEVDRRGGRIVSISRT